MVRDGFWSWLRWEIAAPTLLVLALWPILSILVQVPHAFRGLFADAHPVLMCVLWFLGIWGEIAAPHIDARPRPRYLVILGEVSLYAGLVLLLAYGATRTVTLLIHDERIDDASHLIVSEIANFSLGCMFAGVSFSIMVRLLMRHADD